MRSYAILQVSPCSLEKSRPANLFNVKYNRSGFPSFTPLTFKCTCTDLPFLSPNCREQAYRELYFNTKSSHSINAS